MKHTWTYANIGGTPRVIIKDANDIRHLSELDEKLWTVLACPASGLEISEESLQCMDIDGDNKIHIRDIVDTASWLCDVLNDPQVLFEAKPILPVSALKDEKMLEAATPIAVDGFISLEAVKQAIKNMTIEMQVVPQAPYTDEIIAAYKLCKESYANYFSTSRLQSLGLATLPADIVVPNMSEEAFIEMGKKISDYEVSKVTIEKTNAEALVEAQKQYKLLEKLLLLCRDYCTILRNFVSFQDFYAKRVKSVLGRNADDESPWAIFQVGTLLIDQRACNLCLRVTDLSKHNVQAPDSGMFLIYCHCTLHLTGETMQIVAAMTVGDVRNIKVGKNALFYDRQGRDWEAEVIKVIDNPISIGQAFWSPYRKVADWVIGLVNKSVEEKEKKNFSEATTKIQTTADKTKSTKVPEKVAPFDIAKFAGIFAAIGMAIGYIGSFLTELLTGVGNMVGPHFEFWWKIPLAILGLILVFSGPSMILACFKLRRRNLAPLLNANGWAINAGAIVSVLFGNTLTEQAQFPAVRLKDPFARKGLSKTAKWMIAISCLLVGVGIALFFIL
jgi:hypothetical protein